MNATPPVSRTPSTPASVNSSKSGSQAPDFATALTSAAAKPTRRAGGHKTAGAGAIGGHLPADGNVPPPAAPSASAGSAAPAAVLAAGTGGNTSTAGFAVDAGTGAVSAAAAKIPQTSDSAGLGPVAAAPDPADAGPAGTAAMKLGAMVLGLPLVQLGAPGVDGTPIPGNMPTATPAAASTALLANSQEALATSRSVAAALTAATGAGAKHPTDTAAAAAAIAALKAATSGSSSSDGVSGPVTNADAANIDGNAAPAAAAMFAAATGLVVSNDAGFAGAAVDAPAPGAKAAPGTQAPKGAPALAATPSAATAAAHAIAQEVSAVADAGASDRHATGGTGPALLSGIPGDAALGAAQSGVNPLSVADSAPTPTLNVPAAVDTPEFGQGIADRVSWMVDNNLNGAKLQVNPPQLGPIEVRIAVQGGHAQVWLVSHSAVTRDALESSSPKLREMLGAQGFGQVSVDISQGSFHERPAYSQPYDWTPPANRGPVTGAVQSTTLSPRASSGALDAYA